MFPFFKNQTEDTIPIKEIDHLLGKIELIDIREPYEYDQTHIEGAVNIPMGALLGDPDAYLEAGKKYYLMCQSGNRSGRAMHALRANGFDVINVAGGIGAYTGKHRK